MSSTASEDDQSPRELGVEGDTGDVLSVDSDDSSFYGRFHPFHTHDLLLSRGTRRVCHENTLK